MPRLVPVLLVLTACTAPAPGDARALHPGRPEVVGFSTARLARIDTAVTEWVAKGEIPGAVALVARHGTIVYHQAIGYDDVAAKTPLAKDAIFRIASQSKAITSVAVMMLYEEGKFALDDPVSKFIPAFKGQPVFDKFNEKDGSYTTVPAKRGITVRHLLTHTAGISYPYWGTPWERIYGGKGLTIGHTFGHDDSGETLAGPMSRLGAAPLLHQPGEKFSYGFSVDLLGYLVEVWSGQTLDDFVRARIFEPLGMTDSYFNVPAEKAGRMVTFHRADSVAPLVKRDWLVFPSKDSLPLDFPLRKKVYFGGGGGLSGTIMDYAVFLQMLANGGEYRGVRLLAPSTVRLMTTNQIGTLEANEAGDKFGLGFSLVAEKSAGKSPAGLGTYGWGGALATVYWVDPVNDLIILFYRQMWGGPPGTVEQRFRGLVYQAMVE
ncbi:MAG: serine hydrolase domain-containing protein [Gemmatimonadales bacterium]